MFLDISCGWPVEAPTNGSMTFLNNGEPGENSYEITISYKCDKGFLFATGDVELINTCQWDKSWNLTSLPTCKRKSKNLVEP